MGLSATASVVVTLRTHFFPLGCFGQPDSKSAPLRVPQTGPSRVCSLYHMLGSPSEWWFCGRISILFSLNRWLKSLKQDYLWKTKEWETSDFLLWLPEEPISFNSFFSGHWTFPKYFLLGNQNGSCLKLNLQGERKANHPQVGVLFWWRNHFRAPCHIWSSAERTQGPKLSRNICPCVPGNWLM